VIEIEIEDEHEDHSIGVWDALTATEPPLFSG
jgi:hypothetical protein